jgi:glycosyltransferase A (GT-A) superfamily protein (DUF2064 family)
LNHTRKAVVVAGCKPKTLWLAGEEPTDSAFSGWMVKQQRLQPAGDLGAADALSKPCDGFGSGATAAVIIVAPTALTSAHLDAAFQHLASHDVVVGPARDGGYHLLGMRTLTPDFNNKEWSTLMPL